MIVVSKATQHDGLLEILRVSGNKASPAGETAENELAVETLQLIIITHRAHTFTCTHFLKALSASLY